MAKHVILESYSFTPANNNIIVTGKNIRPEQLLLITNVTNGTVIYNFSDPSLGAASHTNSTNTSSGLEITNITLNYNTSAMNAGDKLAILTEETYQEITPAETMRDPVDKLRVSEGQALIDTDFEYGLQPSKWEQITLLNNRPSAFYDATQPISNTASNTVFTGSSGTYVLTNVTATSNVVTVNITNTTGIVAGTPIFLQGTLDIGNTDGWWVVEGVVPNSSISFKTTNVPTQVSGTLFDPTKTYLYIGTFYTGSGIPVSPASGGAITLTGGVGTVTSNNAHGLRPGDGFYIVGATGNTATLNSSWVVATTPTNNTFTFNTNNGGGGTITVPGAYIYPRSLGYVEHRAYQGAVTFANLTPYHGYQVIRQTRRQFRYQSGKAIQFSTGSIMKPPFLIMGITSSGTTVTVTTRLPHGVLTNAYVTVTGVNESGYNGTFQVVSTPTPTTFTYTAITTPGATTATGFPITVVPQSWYGGANRIGMFDNQNGFFFEFDGQQIYAVRRNSVKLISGTVSATPGSSSITGSSTKFSTELKPGDMIVIRGMSYKVDNITSDTQLYIYPEYRGASSVTNCVVNKTVDVRYTQSQWNIDKMDGTGASKFNLDLGKMQMFYMDYTWYGAGAIRFGFKNNRGEVIYCHRIPNNNVGYEAYLRSGNLVARYETNTNPYYTYLTSSLASGTVSGSISVADTTGWPSTGIAVLTQAGATGATIEYISYTAITQTSLVIGSRAQTGGSVTAQNFTITGGTAINPGGTAPIKVELYSPQQASTISHWGSSVIMDGKFDNDKSFIFNGGMNTALNNQTANQRLALMSIRLAPSVDSGTTGILGSREIINRMQLALNSMDAYCTGTTFRVDLILNGKIGSGTFASVGGSSLAQVAYHSSNTTISGGESVYSFFTNNGQAITQDLSLVRDIGNSILGGGNNNTVPTSATGLYPDGPDVLTIAATALASPNSINARISWVEAQA